MLYFVDFSKPIDDFCEARRCTFGYSETPTAGGAYHQAQLHGVSFTKRRDSMTNKLFQHCAVGTAFNTVSIELYRDEDSDVYMIYKLSNVVIASFNSSAKGEESVGLNYKTMAHTYYG
jgi:type VI protein secretion system component Hcp